MTNRKKRTNSSGKLRIGDDWNAITIIALSQSNPLKAVAEFIENSIDANARHIEIVRGRENNEPYLRITDDGTGIPRNDQGIPDFKYVATHICDSVKRQLKLAGSKGLQGEFGIGLLSFWTVGEGLLMRCTSDEGKTYEMQMSKGNPNYTVRQRRSLFAESGTELTIKPLLSGLRHFSGEKIQWYLASELRDRIRQSGVEIHVIDRQARKQFKVEPRKFDGRLLHGLPESDKFYLELYITNPSPKNEVGLYRAGTRILPNISDQEAFDRSPWNNQHLEGIVDAGQLNLTPGTRSGVIHDEQFAQFERALKPVEAELIREIEAQQNAEEERASRQILRTITRAFREALIALPAEEYDWFDIYGKKHADKRTAATAGGSLEQNRELEEEAVSNELERQAGNPSADNPAQKQLFEFAGPLANLRISPSSSVVAVGKSRTFRGIARDKNHRQIDREVLYQWRVIEGSATLTAADAEIMTFTASAEPGLVKLQLTATEGELVYEAHALVTITETLVEISTSSSRSNQGLPAYSFKRAAGELWRSRYDNDRNIIIVNSGHRDFIFASNTKALKLRYICKLYSKEMVLKNFPGLKPDELLERMLEVSMYTEENLR